MNIFVKLGFLFTCVFNDITECKPQNEGAIRLQKVQNSRVTKPIISNDCQSFRTQCSALCDTNVENDQCWGSPRYVQCVCANGFHHFIEGYECKHTDCPKAKVVDGTTKRPIQRKRKPLLRRKQPQRTSDPDTKLLNVQDGQVHLQSIINSRVTKPIISDECKDFKYQCTQVCFNAVENDQCWGSPAYRVCKCNNGQFQLIPGYDCEHSDCKSCDFPNEGFGSCIRPKFEQISFEQVDS